MNKDDINYFKNELYISMGIPPSMMEEKFVIYKTIIKEEGSKELLEYLSDKVSKVTVWKRPNNELLLLCSDSKLLDYVKEFKLEKILE